MARQQQAQQPTRAEGRGLLWMGIMPGAAGVLAWYLLSDLGAWYASVSVYGGVGLGLALLVIPRRWASAWWVGALLLVAALGVAYVAAGMPRIVWGGL